MSDLIMGQNQDQFVLQIEGNLNKKYSCWLD